MRRDRERHGPGQCRCLYLASKDRLLEGDRKVHPQVEPIAFEKWVRGDVDGDERVPGWTAVLARCALSLEPDLLAVLDAGGNAGFELAPIGEHDTPRTAKRGFVQGNRGLKLNVGPFSRLGAPSPAAAQTAEQVGEDIFAPQTLGPVAAAPMEFEALRPAAACTTARAKALLKSARTCPWPRVEALIEALRLSGRIDFSTVELGTLFLIAENFVGAADFLELLDGLGIVRMGVGMMFLGERAEGLLDFGLGGFLGDTQNLVWIAHRSSLYRLYIGRVCPSG